MRRLAPTNILGITTKSTHDDYGGNSNNNNNNSDIDSPYQSYQSPSTSTTTTTTTASQMFNASDYQSSTKSSTSTTSSSTSLKSYQRDYSSSYVSSSSPNGRSHIGSIKSNYYQVARSQQSSSTTSPWLFEVIQDMLKYIYTSIVQTTNQTMSFSSRNNSSNGGGGGGGRQQEFPQAQITLDKTTRKHFDQFKQFISVKYDMKNEEHEKMLMALWDLCMNHHHVFPAKKSKKNSTAQQQPTKVELESRISHQWKHLGFQGTNPATDFRGSGILGLENLIYFGTKYPSLFYSLYSRTRTNSETSYPFVIAGLNVTMMLHDILGIGMNARKCNNLIARKKLIELISDCARVEQEEQEGNNSSQGKKQKKKNRSSKKRSDSSEEDDGSNDKNKNDWGWDSDDDFSSKRKKKSGKTREANLLDFGEESYNASTATTTTYSLGVDDDEDDNNDERSKNSEKKKQKKKQATPSNKQENKLESSDATRKDRFQVFHELYVTAFIMLDKQWHRTNSNNYFCFPEVLDSTRQQMEDLIELKFDSLEDIMQYNQK